MSLDMDELLKKCAEEKIQFIAEVQEFACLFAVDENFTVKVVSENIDQFDSRLKLGKDLKSILGEKDCDQLEKNIFREDLITNYSIKLGSEEKKFYCYRTGDLYVFEHEIKKDETHVTQKEGLISAITSFSLGSMSYELGLKSLANLMAKNIKSFIGYDRVMVYQFHPDLHGEVIAEAKEEHLEPFIGMHYPESDIPKQARELFIRNQIRLISHIKGDRIGLQTTDDIKALDLSDSISRSPSIVHVEYLKNMKVGASLTISIILDGKLWGLIACHHYKEKFISFASRSFLKLIGFSFAAEVGKYRASLYNERLKKVNMITVSFMDKIARLKDNFQTSFLEDIVQGQSANLKSLQSANGFYLQVGNDIFTAGEVPPSNIIEFIEKEVLKAQESPFFSTNNLSALDSSFKSVSSKTSGVLAAGLVAGDSKCLVMWFRPEVREEIKWAGKDDKEVVYDGDQPRLTPRGSFDEIIRLQTHSSLPFDDQDRKIAFEFLWFLSKVLLEQLRLVETNIKNLEREASEKDRFISNLSHELRTPLNNILGWMQLYDEDLKVNERLEELAGVIKSNSKQQLKLVNDLLEVSKISSGKITLDVHPSDIRANIEKVTKYFQPSFENKDIECFLSLGSEELICTVDETRFEQVLRNIIQNALKFTPKGGEVFIKAKKKDSDVSIEVKDSGVGIAPEEVKNVFKQFYQTDSSRSRINKGMGLGLSLVKNIVELHGGRVRIKSEGSNAGTSVIVKLPLSSLKARPHVTESKPVSAEGSVLVGKKILLVEDTLDSARFIKIYLEKHGAEVEWLSNAKDALRLLVKREFDLILSDIGLPNMDGLEFVAKAREIELNSKKPYVAISAYGTKDEVQRSLSAGFDNHLVKPVDLHQLIEEAKIRLL